MTNPIDIAPEHTKRRSIAEPMGGELHPDHTAAYAYVESVLPTAVEDDGVSYHVWHGWAMREAFLAGISYAKENTSPTQNLGD